MISAYVDYLDKKWEKFEEIPDNNERLKFTQTWMKNMVKWSNSEFNNSLRVNDLAEDFVIKEESYDSYIDIMAETEREDIKLWLKDLHNNWSELDANRLIKLREVYLRLELHEKVLYDLYFTQMLSLREIGKRIDIPYMSVYSMIKELKNKIKLWIGEK